MTKAVCSISIIFVIIGQISATTTNSPIVSPQCYNYTLINDPTRSINVTSSGSSACDTSIFSSTPMWVRFVGSGGSKIPTSAVAKYQCNTDAPGWYSGNMPITVNTTTSGSVCFAWSGSSCYWNSTISVTNCGWYYVYELVAPSTCSLRYCTDEPTNWTEPTTEMSTEGETTSTEISTTVDKSTAYVQTTANVPTTNVATSVAPSNTQVQTTRSNPSTPPQTCFSPKLTLIPGSSTLASPLQYRRSQDFYIMSIIEVNCNDSLSTIKKWTIKNCSSTCSYQLSLDQTIQTTFTELHIPARTLPFGLYQLQFTVTMANYTNLTTSSSVYVQVTSSGIVANLVQLGTSMITIGYKQDLEFDPGTFSVDPDEYTFNGSSWKYEYFCRIYGLYMFPNAQGSLIPIDGNATDPLNPSCFGNRTRNETKLIYGGTGLSLKSSLTIRANSLQSNRTYQFMVTMTNQQNASIQATGYVLVKVEDTSSQMIAIGCVISTMCVSNMEFQLVNPTTQVALFSFCVDNCQNTEIITWNVYQGSVNISSNVTQWVLFNQMSAYENIWFFGRSTSNFTAANNLFLNNPQISLWRFEVNYTVASEASLSSLNFVINQPPKNGSCSVSPHNGTTSTSFSISCPNWFDEDGIIDYSVYGWTDDSTEETMIAFSSISTFQVLLPIGDDQTSTLHLTVHIRDSLDCVTEYNLSSVTVLSDLTGINDLVNSIQSSSDNSANSPLLQLLASGNPNTVGQILSSVSQQFNKINNESVNKAVLSGIPAASISVSPLGSEPSTTNSVPLNQTALDEFNKQTNSYASTREYLMQYTTNLDASTANNIKLQASSLVQLTQATNQLTRTTITIASDRCYQLALALKSLATQISYEDVQAAVNQIVQCASNIQNAANGPLQQRTNVLDLDSSRATQFPTDYDTDLESDWANPNLFSDGTDFSWEAIQKGRNTYYQNQLANEITEQVQKILSVITSTINIHLNIGQNLQINTPSAFMTLETVSLRALSSKQVQQVANAKINLPANIQSNVTDNSTVSLRSMLEPLASFGNAKTQTTNTNLSRSVSLSVLDQYGNKVSPIKNLQSLQTNDYEWILIPSIEPDGYGIPSVFSDAPLHHFGHLSPGVMYRWIYVNLIDSSMPIYDYIHRDIELKKTCPTYRTLVNEAGVTDDLITDGDGEEMTIEDLETFPISYVCLYAEVISKLNIEWRKIDSNNYCNRNSAMYLLAKWIRQLQ
ncbi:unnamed protein product [Adineta ricciae]|uniref:PKD/REJ-like domain-containing protein n=2 Tax=Adineta ricciae TaxID=249248 RepID=A0A815DL30_ADIRI|nr:unnamed protein product [Adineta ricciae]